MNTKYRRGRTTGPWRSWTRLGIRYLVLLMWYSMFGIWCWCLVSGIWYWLFGITNYEIPITNTYLVLIFGKANYEIPRTNTKYRRGRTTGQWRSGTRRGFWYLVFDIWYLVFDIDVWRLILDMWYLISGICYLLYNVWYLVLIFCMTNTKYRRGRTMGQ